MDNGTLGAEAYVYSTNGNYEFCLTAGTNFSCTAEISSLQPKLRVCLTNQLANLTLPASGTASLTSIQTAPGYILSGHVYGVATNALTNGQVWAQFTNVSTSVDQESPNFNGFYQLLIPAGIYEVGTYGFSDAQYVDQTCPSNLVVNGNVSGLDFFLSQGAYIMGNVSGAGNPQTNISVQVGAITFGAGNSWLWQQTYFGQTDSNGNYSITVPAGTNYFAAVAFAPGAAWLGQFYSNATDAVNARIISTQAGAPATNINFFLQPSALIEGRVLGSNAPLTAAFVEAGFLVSNTWQFVAGSSTDTNGSYILTLPAATKYIVKADAPGGTLWLEQFYNQVSSNWLATPIAAQAGTPATNINFFLPYPSPCLLQAPTRLAGGVFTFAMPTTLGHHYNIYSSTNLHDWTILVTTSGFNGTLLFMDPSATSFPQRFYYSTETP